MEIAAAQREMRFAFLGGFVGQLVSALLWAISAALATWSQTRHAIPFLLIAGAFIFPLTKAGLRLIGRPGSVSEGNTLYALGAQVAFVLPLSLPVVGAATLYRLEWFYPSLMIVLGAHYLPFVFLYGMKMFAVLGGILWLAGLGLGLWVRLPFSAGAWITSVLLVGFALYGRHLVLAEEVESEQEAP